MKVKVWNKEYAPFPREGLNHLSPSENCMFTQLLKLESSRWCRLSQLEPPATPEELRVFQSALRKKIWEKLGSVYDRDLPLETTIFGKNQYDGFSVTKLSYQGQKGVHVTGFLYVPDGPGPFPAVMHMHGHNPEGKYAERVQSTSLALVKSGYICLIVDAFGTYERASICRQREYHGAVLGGSLFNIGESLMGAQLVENMRGVDLLLSLPQVIKERIGATGASGGGNQTMWLAAMDERIAAAMPVVSVGTFQSYVTGVNCICELLPDGLTFTDEAGILALIAPRPLNIGNAHYDVNHTFSVGEMLMSYHQVEEVYWSMGCPDNLAYTVANRTHGYHDEQREAVIGWFDCHLKGIGHGKPRPEPEYEIFPEEELYPFPADQRPENICTISRYSRQAGERLHQVMMECGNFDGDAKREALRHVLRLREVPAVMDLKKYADVKGYKRMALQVGDHLIPIVMKPGSNEGKYRLLLVPEGKNALTDEQISACGEDGATVVMADLIGSGETAQGNNITGEFMQFIRQTLWLGRSMPGEWVFDIIALCRMLKRDFNAENIEIEAHREAGVCAVFAGALTGDLNIKAVDIPGSLVFRHKLPSFISDPFKLRTEGCLYTAMLSMPGFLKWGDISLAVALADCDCVELVSPRLCDGVLMEEVECQALAEEIAALSERII